MNTGDPAAGRWNDRRALWLLVALLPLAFAARVLVAGDAFGSDGDVLLARNDASYHARRALYTFENFPRILWFDSYLAWPDGAPVPMPPLYDWALGAAARAFGSSERVFERVLAWAPPMLGALALLPVFAAGRWLAGPRLGLLAAGILCVLPLHAEFSRLGNADHHAWVALLSACWLALVLQSTREEQGGAALAVALRAAVMMAVLLSWSGSVLLIAVAEGSLLAAWVFGGSARCLRIQAWAAAVASAGVVPWVAMAPTPLGGAFSSTTLSWLHPTVLIGLAGLSSGLALFERRRTSRDASERALRATTLGLLIVGILFVFLPLWESLAPGVRFVSGEDVWRNRNPEQQQLFHDLWTGQNRIGLPHIYYGAFAYLIPLALVAIVPLLRAAERRPTGVVLAVWYIVFGTLALLQLRYGNEFSIPGALTFALLLDGSAGWAARRVSFLRGREALVATVATALLMAPALSGYFQNRIPSVVSKITAPDSGVPALSETEALTRLMIALRGATPETGGYLDAGKPEYGVLVRPALGHIALYRGRRATPAGNFGPYLDPEKLQRVMTFYFRTDSDADALEILRELDVRYLVTEPDRPARAGFVRRLHDENGSAESGEPHVARFRLVTESPAATRTPGTLKVFEFVPGADVRIETAPEAEVRAEIPLVTPTGREFRFRTHTRASPNGLALLRLPYATSGNGAVRALGPYRIEVGDEVQQLAVSEEGVRTGRTIRLHIGR